MPIDYVYWTFSAAAQCISAFVAFLLTGYALFHTLLERLREKDDSYEEVLQTLRAAHHRWLTILSWLTGAGIFFSLLVVYFTRQNCVPSVLVFSAVAAIDTASVVGGLWFVVSIVNPKKYQIAAEQELEQESREATTPVAEFFDAFVHLERLIRDFLQKRDMYIPSRGAPKMSFSFRQMIEALRQNEFIDYGDFQELMELNKYRNLVFHGHVNGADPLMLQRVESMTEKLKTIFAEK